ncbi:universal stress protein [Pseudomonas sp. ABC1]|uniref:universal stress protein n=1 Tax=Pseudomonas sp. ABC1 TaxID=2748080 RepID=UPI0015C3B02A|nr:universal stress protein [Pseudomonas sp. ABC1]QLF93270.1 universal stress protein [Pseudomonas sp. ABC1]
MVQPILVAHDLSHEADIALRRAVQLARQTSSSLHLVHVASAQTDEGDARQGLQERLAALAPDIQNCWIRHGNPVEEVLTLAHGLEASLLVLGRHHRQSPRGFAGTTLERILLGSDIPLLLAVRDDTSPYSRALAALDFSGAASRAMQAARNLLPEDAHLHALHIHEKAEIEAVDDDEQALQLSLFEQLLADLQQTWPTHGPNLSHSLVAGERSRRLEQVIEQQRPDVLAMGTSRREEMSSALLGSLSREVLEQPPCDILVAP